MTVKSNWDKIMAQTRKGTAIEAWADRALEAYNKAIHLECSFAISLYKA